MEPNVELPGLEPAPDTDEVNLVELKDPGLVAPVPVEEDVKVVEVPLMEVGPVSEPPTEGLRPEPVKVWVPLENPEVLPSESDEPVLEKEVDPPEEGLEADPVPVVRVLLVNPEPMRRDPDGPMPERDEELEAE